ncbi:2OG-Fe(II) oxygenase [Caulobacter sp. 17J80-11]|uniref:2OG-Fe(II) oxygenase family protein n=1 Tax=Caulobacter sp. 17J80-11 TaxID=2763502 RepID=UPI00165381F0|nr:2OG-Fe(II) oxygenase [Caulobacter sp. 17J80-11]MBC6980260.1 2OG-Fe(II) oxygenase [Caulobacter sp. 17J80-11]
MSPDPRTTLSPGDPAPWFRVASTSNPRYVFDTVAGRYVVLAFLGSAASAEARAALAAVEARRPLFDDERASFFGVSTDPDDQAQGRLVESLPGVRFFLDFERAVSRLYGAAGEDDGYRPFCLLLDPMLRVLARAPLERIGAVADLLATLPPPEDHAGAEIHAPVLILPRVFEPEFCRRLIEIYEQGEAQDSGFMREIDGKTVLVLDHAFKRRTDHELQDAAVIQAAKARIQRRIVPEIAKAFQFQVTRMERHLVACYDGETGGWFRPHRDNTTAGTAHRRFAVTINLNAEAYEGGELMFPEFGPRRYKAPTGGAVVFGCGLLHTVAPVTRGRRYAFLPFLYDEAAARLREANNAHLGEGVGAYRSGDSPAA